MIDDGCIGNSIHLTAVGWMLFSLGRFGERRSQLEQSPLSHLRL